MKLLLLNPNITEAVTNTMLEEARRSASPGTEIVAATARFGVQYVENRIEAAIASHAVVEALADHADGIDAAIIAAFGDPGLWAGKELMSVPVIGISEAAFLTAYTLGKRYSVVCLTERLRTWYIESAYEHGLAARLASVRACDVAPADIARAKDEMRGRLFDQCLAAVEEDRAEVLIVGGGPIAGLARELADRLPVPILDGVSCAVRMAEALVGLAPRKAVRGSLARPGAKPSRGLAPELTRMLSVDRDNA
jgi:Asp/Glu/hydantoin racemase